MSDDCCGIQVKLQQTVGLRVTVPAIEGQVVRLPAGQGPAGPKGDKGDTGATGPGVASGGNTGQVLTKTSNTDNATDWRTPLSAISGEATGTNSNGAANVTLNNDAVIAKVLNGYSSNAGTIGATDTILTAIEKLNGNDGLKANIAGQAFSGPISATNLSGSNTGDQTITLSGEATGTGTGSLPTTLSNAAVIAKVLTGFTSGPGAVSASDSLLSAVQKLNGNLEALVGGIFGSGLDGDANITTSITLVRDMHYRNLTISGSGKIFTNGWRIYVSATTDITAAGAGAINCNSGNAGAPSGATPGSGAGGGIVARTSVTTGFANGGGAGSINNGANSSAGSNVAFLAGGASGKGGNGGAGGTGTGGTGGAASVGSQFASWDFREIPLNIFATGANAAAPQQVFASAQPPGGAGGGGDGTNSGGGGGSSANAAGAVCFTTRYLNRGTSTAVSAIQAVGVQPFAGAAGVAGNSGGGGGGGGAGGGLVWIVIGTLLGSAATNCVDVSGGQGGNGGAGKGTGIGGSGGDGGQSGKYNVFVLSTSQFLSNTSGTAGSAGTTGSGITAGTGGAGASAKFNL